MYDDDLAGMARFPPFARWAFFLLFPPTSNLLCSALFCSAVGRAAVGRPPYLDAPVFLSRARWTPFRTIHLVQGKQPPSPKSVRGSLDPWTDGRMDKNAAGNTAAPQLNWNSHRPLLRLLPLPYSLSLSASVPGWCAGCHLCYVLQEVDFSVPSNH